MAAGSSFIALSSEDSSIAWGVPVAGKFGFEGDVRSSTVPKYIDRVQHLRVLDLCCGYGHMAFVVDATGSEKARATLEDCPELSPPKFSAVVDSKRPVGSTGAAG
jgi:hypothetical protein